MNGDYLCMDSYLVIHKLGQSTLADNAFDEIHNGYLIRKLGFMMNLLPIQIPLSSKAKRGHSHHSCNVAFLPPFGIAWCHTFTWLMKQGSIYPLKYYQLLQCVQFLNHSLFLRGCCVGWDLECSSTHSTTVYLLVKLYIIIYIDLSLLPFRI